MNDSMDDFIGALFALFCILLIFAPLIIMDMNISHRACHRVYGDTNISFSNDDTICLEPEWVYCQNEREDCEAKR